MQNDLKQTLESVANNDVLLEVGRKAIEDVLIDFRDSRMSMLGRGNGLVVCEKDGTASSVVRLGPEAALRIGLLAIAKATVGVGDEN